MDEHVWTRRGSMAALCAGVLLPSLARAQAPEAAPKPKPDVIQGVEDWSNRLTVPVMLNGKGPYAFLVDTGAERSVVAADVAAALALPMGTPLRVHGVAGEIIANSAIVARLDVGVRTLTDLSLPLLARQDLAADGMLGIDALQGQTVLFDFRKQQIFVQASVRRRLGPDEVAITARSRFGQLVLVDSTFDDEPVLVVVDTGATASIANPSLQRIMERDRRRREERVGAAEIFSVTGQKTTGDWRLAPELKVGGITIGNLPVVFSDLHNFRIWRLDTQPSMLLGMDLLRQFDTVQIDFLHREVRFGVPSPSPGASRASRSG